jgi:hypothetical protein
VFERATPWSAFGSELPSQPTSMSQFAGHVRDALMVDAEAGPRHASAAQLARGARARRNSRAAMGAVPELVRMRY